MVLKKNTLSFTVVFMFMQHIFTIVSRKLLVNYDIQVREDDPIKFKLKLSGGFYQSYGVTVQQDDGPIQDYIPSVQEISTELNIDILTEEVA